MISTKLLREVLETEVKFHVAAIMQINDDLNAVIKTIGNIAYFDTEWRYINIYELAHRCEKWAKKNNIFDMIDWSEAPEQIFKRADELRNATRQYI